MNRMLAAAAFANKDKMIAVMCRGGARYLSSN
jgi:hypothetical protein